MGKEVQKELFYIEVNHIDGSNSSYHKVTSLVMENSWVRIDIEGEDGVILLSPCNINFIRVNKEK